MTTSRKIATTALTIPDAALTVAWFAAPATLAGTAALYAALTVWNLAAIAGFGQRKTPATRRA